MNRGGRGWRTKIYWCTLGGTGTADHHGIHLWENRPDERSVRIRGRRLFVRVDSPAQYEMVSSKKSWSKVCVCSRNALKYFVCAQIASVFFNPNHFINLNVYYTLLRSLLEVKDWELGFNENHRRFIAALSQFKFPWIQAETMCPWHLRLPHMPVDIFLAERSHSLAAQTLRFSERRVQYWFFCFNIQTSGL